MNKIILTLLMVLSSLLSGTASASDDSVAYLAFTDGFWQVWTMHADGSDQKQITKSNYDKSHLSWYPDGESLLVNGLQGEIQKISIKTGIAKDIDLPIKGMADASISPDGEAIVFSLSVAGSIDNNHIWIADNNSKKLIKLTNMPGLQHEPVWSSDGRWIYFLSGVGGQSHDIWRVSVKNKSTEQITTGLLYHFDISVFNNKIAFSSNRTGSYELWIRENNKDIQITSNTVFDGRSTWSQDGKKLIYESLVDGVFNLWMIDASSGNVPSQLTTSSSGARYPVYMYNSTMKK